MFSTTKFTGVVILTFLQNSGIIYCGTNILIRTFEMCDLDRDYPSKMYSSLLFKDNVQSISANITLPDDLGDNVSVFFRAFLATTSGDYIEVIRIRETFCKLIKKYLVPLNLLPEGCPILKGQYHIENVPLHFQKIFITEMLPPGRLKIIGMHSDVKTGQELLCYLLTLEVV